MPSRRDHPACGNAAGIDFRIHQDFSMTAASRQQKLAELFTSATVIPVLTIERLEHAVPLAKALVAGGVRVLEVTLRTPAAIAPPTPMFPQLPPPALAP